MPRRPRRLLAALTCASVALAGVACTSGSAPRGDADGRGDGQAVLSGSDQDGTSVEDATVPPGQTSEGVTGELVAPYPDGLAPRARVGQVRQWRVVPGVTYRRWEQTDRRGRIRAHLLKVNPRRPGVSLDYQSMKYVPQRNTLTGLLGRDGAVAGINGGFFDIYDTGAPLGVGVDRQRGFLHASLKTWNNAFYLDRAGVPRIGKLKVAARIARHPELEITNVNSPRVREGSIGIYTSDWGTTSGYSITDGQRKHVRMVVIDDGRVVGNRTTLNSGKRISGPVLVGRGPGAAALKQLRVGSLASVRWRLPGAGKVAISGEKVLLRGGRRLVENDRELHPRTAVGIDRDNGRILLLVVDGRQSFSRGYTLVELARLMKKVGAEDALNLDGGGSSTLAGLGRSGRRKVLNSPSDGSQRAIADALGVHYDKP